MLTVNNLSLFFGDRVLLGGVSFTIQAGECVGLVGRNGAGKSTFLKILAGEMQPDGGSVNIPGNATLGFLHQNLEINQDQTVMDETMTAFKEILEIDKKIDHLNHQISSRTDYESQEYLNILDEFSELNERFAHLGGDDIEGLAAKVLLGLGFKEKDFNRQINEFSGGWQMRVILAQMLLQKPDYLLLDEPTNHLDIESIIWLEEFLQVYPGAVIIVSHDQQFLDNSTNRTVEIELGNMHDYKAPYSKYIELRKERKTKQMASFNNQQKIIAQKERTITRFMAKASKTKMAQSMQKQLDKIDRIEIEDEDVATMNIRFPDAPRSGEIVVSGEHISKSYGDLKVLTSIDLTIERKDRISFVGQNGQGKTTLAKILIGQLKSTSGKVDLGFNVNVGYYAQNQADTLKGSKTLLQTMEDQSPPELRTRLRSILGAFMFSGEDAEKKVSVLSGGEKARLALACLLLKPINFLVLDEPTNHLDMLSKDVLQHAIKKYNGTLLVISHDRHFLAGLTDKTYEFKDKKIIEHLGDINYFLEKRKMDNMRDVELQKSKENIVKTEKTDNSAQNNDQKRNLEKQITNLEKKISQTESEIKQLESEMAQTGFYESPESSQILKKYNETKSQLTQWMSQWESFQLEYENIN